MTVLLVVLLNRKSLCPIVYDDSQQTINVQIAAQLDKLGKYLDNVERNVAKQSDTDKVKGQKKSCVFPDHINI